MKARRFDEEEFLDLQGKVGTEGLDFLDSEICRNVREALERVRTIYDLYCEKDQLEVQEIRKDIEAIIKEYED